VSSFTFCVFATATICFSASSSGDDSCWSGAYGVMGSSGSSIVCGPECLPEGCVKEIIADPLVGSVLVCNCNDGGAPTRCCQVGVLPMNQGLAVFGRCTLVVCASTPSSCSLLMQYDPDRGEVVVWALCLPSGG